MKRSILIGVGLLMLASLGATAAAGSGPACSEPRTLELTKTKDVPVGFPAEAKVEIKFCPESGSDFVLSVTGKGLPANASYWVTLNGKVSDSTNKPLAGNDLIKKSPQYTDTTEREENYANLGPVVVNGQKELEATVTAKLVAGEYNLKVFLKQADEPYTCVRGNDNVGFTISAGAAGASPASENVAKPIEILAPGGDKIEGHQHLVKGKVADPSVSVHIYICPMGTDDCWLQTKPSAIKPDGSWQTLCNFGEEKVGIGTFYEVYAIVGDTSDASRQTLNQKQEFPDYLKQHPVWDVKTYQRTK